ncbi:hypothetical protein [Ralstonia pseudosolanacearum]|uniref:hypothetical protein n=1 Tax=Ralstonia pseudosolanacearum TaxID=1310165 RepID=UPI003CE6A041
MRPIDQTKHERTGQRGNCLAAALASILEIQINEVPAFEEMAPGAWKEELFEWCAARGYLVVREQATLNLDEAYVLVGISEAGCRHAVVASAGIIVHDPHHLRLGLKTPEYALRLIPHDVVYA